MRRIPTKEFDGHTFVLRKQPSVAGDWYSWRCVDADLVLDPTPEELEELLESGKLGNKRP